MKYLILADIHANMEALEQVLGSASGFARDKTVVLGDLVGYGASPNEVIEAIRTLGSAVVLRGNHDKVCSGLEDGSNFNEAAYTAAYWTRKHLKKENLAFLASLSPGPVELEEGILICHGSPIDEDAYIFNEYDAMVVFQSTERDIIFFGHTHFPVIYSYRPESGLINVEIPFGKQFGYLLEEGVRYLINPGSTGQPRDGNSDASYCVFDSSARTLTINRVSYTIRETSGG